MTVSPLERGTRVRRVMGARTGMSGTVDHICWSAPSGGWMVMVLVDGDHGVRAWPIAEVNPVESEPAGHPWLKDEPSEPSQHPWLAKEEEEPAVRRRRVIADLELGDFVRRKRDGRAGVVVRLTELGFEDVLVRWGRPGLAPKSIAQLDELELVARRADIESLSEGRSELLPQALEWISAALESDAPYLAELVRRWMGLGMQTRANLILLVLDGIDDYDRAEILRIAGGAT